MPADGEEAARVGRRRWPAIVAALACLTIVGIGVGARLAPGELDDKTALFMGSAIGPASVPALLALRAETPRILRDCHGAPACEWRTRTRLSGLLNYLALGQTLRAAWRWEARSDAPWCARLGRAFVGGVALLHGLLYLVFLALLATDRSPGGRYGGLALLMLVAAVLEVLGPGGARAPVGTLGALFWVEPRHSIFMWVPRGALGLVFAMQVACFVSGRLRAFAALTVLSLLVHTVQSSVLNAVFIAAAALRLVVGDGRREAAAALGVVGVVTLLGVALSRVMGTGFGITLVPSRPLTQAIALRGVLLGGAAVAGLLALLSARGRALARSRWGPAFLLAIPLCLLLAGLDAVSRAFGAVPLLKVASERVSANVAPVLGAVPLLAAAAALRALAARRRTVVPSFATAAAVVGAIALAVVVPLRTGTLALWWRLARTHVRTVPAEFCRILPEPVRVDDVGSIEPRPEPRFHMQLFDWLDRAGRPTRPLPRRESALRRAAELPSCARRT